MANFNPIGHWYTCRANVSGVGYRTHKWAGRCKTTGKYGAPTAIWTVDGSYTAFDLTPHLAAGSQDAHAALEDGTAPRAQWQLRSQLSPSRRATFDLAVFHVGRLTNAGAAAYTRADASAEWRFTRALSVMAIGQNLTESTHAEFAGTSAFVSVTRVPRSGSLRLRWTFR